jgi:hypothetical protein
MMNLVKRLYSVDDVSADFTDCEQLIKNNEEKYVIAACHGPEKVLYPDNEISWDRPLWYALKFRSSSEAERHLEKVRDRVVRMDYITNPSGEAVPLEYIGPLSVFKLSESAKHRKSNDEIWLALHKHVKLGGEPL